MPVTLLITVIRSCGAPIGIVTLNCVAFALAIVPAIEPKYTALLVGVVSKLVPVIVTTVPGSPDVGATEAMVGEADNARCSNTTLSIPDV